MNLLRSKFLIVIVSVLVLTGYASDLFDDCDDPLRGETAVAGHMASGSTKERPQMTGDECQCLCHQVFSNAAVGPIRVGEALVFTEVGFIARSEVPPDAEPRAIDHPPQLV